ncbi:MAG: MarR family transcriptional regulator [Rhodothermales bacterium]
MNTPNVIPVEPEVKVGLSFLVSQVGAYAANTFSDLLRTIDLTPQHVGILRILASKPHELTQTALANRLSVLPSRLVALLDEIEARGLLERKPNEEDRRSKVLRITKKGEKTFLRAEMITRTLETQLFSTLSETERAKLSATMKKLADNLGLAPGVHPAYRNHNQ